MDWQADSAEARVRRRRGREAASAGGGEECTHTHDETGAVWCVGGCEAPETAATKQMQDLTSKTGECRPQCAVESEVKMLKMFKMSRTAQLQGTAAAVSEDMFEVSESRSRLDSWG